MYNFSAIVQYTISASRRWSVKKAFFISKFALRQVFFVGKLGLAPHKVVSLFSPMGMGYHRNGNEYNGNSSESVSAYKFEGKLNRHILLSENIMKQY